MNQSATIERLTNHLRQLEAEISDIRRELKSLPQHLGQAPLAETTIAYAFADKVALKEQMQLLFVALSIKAKPIGAEKLQQQMVTTELTAKELSQSIIATREE